MSNFDIFSVLVLSLHYHNQHVAKGKGTTVCWHEKRHENEKDNIKKMYSLDSKG